MLSCNIIKNRTEIISRPPKFPLPRSKAPEGPSRLYNLNHLSVDANRGRPHDPGVFSGNADHLVGKFALHGGSGTPLGSLN